MSIVKPVRAAIYARVSTTNHGQDVGLQLHDLRRIASERNWSVVGEFVDEGVSGSAESRPALDRMMGLVKAAKVDVVAVWRFDRAARSTQHLLRLLDECRLHRVDFLSVKESIDTTTATGKLVFTLIAAISEFEKALIVERVQAGVDRARALGKHVGRPRHDLDLRAATILLGQGHSVRQVAGMLGMPRATLARRLAEAGPKATPAERA